MRASHAAIPVVCAAVLATLVPVPAAAAGPTATTTTLQVVGNRAAEAVSLFATITPTSGSTAPTGTVTFTDGSTVLATGTSYVQSGSVAGAQMTTYLLGPGPHSFAAHYSGDAADAAGDSAASPVTIVAEPTSVTVASTANPAAAGSRVALTATVRSAQPVATLSYSATAPVYGDGQWADDPTNATFSASATSAELGFEVRDDRGDWQVTLTPPAGQELAGHAYDGGVSVTRDGQSCTGSTGNFVVGSLEQAADGSLAEFGATFESFCPGATSSGVSGTIHWQAADPTGSVSFSADGTALGTAPLGGRQAATLSTSALTLGAHYVCASYSGDGTFAAAASADSNGCIWQQVLATPTLTVTPTSLQGAYGSGGTAIAVTVAGGAGGPTPTGGVTLQEAGSVVGSASLDTGGAATLGANPLLSPGSHTVSAVYGGDAHYSAQTSAPLTLTIAMGSPQVYVQEASYQSQEVVDVPATFRAWVAGNTEGQVADGAGTLTFRDGATVLCAQVPDGPNPVLQATCTHAWHTAGQHSVTATYDGDANNQPITSAALPITVVGEHTVVTLTATPNPSRADQRVTLVAHVTGAPAEGGGVPVGGVVGFTVDGANAGIGTIASDGTASVTTQRLPAGDHSFQASFTPDSNTGAFVAGASAVVTHHVSTASPTQMYVDRVYDDLLGRVADPGAAGWVSALDRGAPRGGVAAAIATSSEFRSDLVVQDYRDVLRRDPEAQGLRNWVQYIAAGATFEQLEASLLGSPEYYANRGLSTDDGFLDALFWDILGRGVDAAGRAYWKHLLATGTSRAQIALSVLDSTECDQNYVRQLYAELLRRAPDDGGLTVWVHDLQRGVRDEDLITSLISSNEYFADAQHP